MRYIYHTGLVLLAVASCAGGPAHAINRCQAKHLACATTMPIDGYCQCTAHGTTEDGTVMPNLRGPINASAGGCGAHPHAPGCH